MARMAYNKVALFLGYSRITINGQLIKEYLCRLFEGDAMLLDVRSRLIFIPLESYPL